MTDYGSSIAIAGEGSSAHAQGHRVVHFPSGERINTFLYDGLLPSACSNTSSSSSSSSGAFPLCGALSGHHEGELPPPAAEVQHPLEVQQRQYMRQREQQQLMRAAAIYGLHAPLRLKMERELCAMTQRLPGLPSSLWGLQTLMNLDEEISVEDYMGRDKPEDDEWDAGAALGVHERIEKHFGLL